MRTHRNVNVILVDGKWPTQRYGDQSRRSHVSFEQKLQRSNRPWKLACPSYILKRIIVCALWLERLTNPGRSIRNEAPCQGLNVQRCLQETRYLQSNPSAERLYRSGQGDHHTWARLVEEGE
jgi:hypothetical protein